MDEPTDVVYHRRLAGPARAAVRLAETVPLQKRAEGYVLAAVEVHAYDPARYFRTVNTV